MAEGLGRVVEAVDPEGGAVLEFEVRAPDAFVRWLLPFGAQALILDPADLAARLASERARVRAVYS
jgi:predicted DNA-binding transcriptional regulator YafY